MEGERVIAGLSCGDVLRDLSEYLDDQLSAGRRAQIGDHLRGCANCERFGGEFGAAIAALRRSLTNPDPPEEAVVRRLRERLHRDRR
jgi:anti-sigma factor RsiW